MTKTFSVLGSALVLALACVWRLDAQNPEPGGRAAGAGPAAGQAAPAGRGAGRGPAQPQVDPAIVARGRGLYSVNCATCHGSEARGGESGPNLLRSAMMLDDDGGTLLVPFVKVGRPDKGMPPRPDLTDALIRDIALFLRTLRTTGRD